ncbi:MAG: 6,7-dimethyl-8-ribityllumazine synthase, partial [Verrucomicrobiales bacterium]
MPSKNLPPKPRSIAAKKTVSIIASLYNEDLVDSLLNSAIQELRSLLPGITVNVYRVPGAFEIPVCAKRIIQTNTIDVIIALGVIIKGETSHADLVGNSVTQSLQE